MNEGAPVMFHAGGGYGPGVYVMPMERPRQYGLEVVPTNVTGTASPSTPSTPRRWQRRDRQKDTAFGYDSDDSSLSSNASSSNKSGEKGECTSSNPDHTAAGNTAQVLYNAREWRGRRRDVRPQRRLAPERFFKATYPFQVKFTPDDLLNGSKYDTLSQEIWDKFVKSQQTEETFRKKMNLWRYLYVTIKTIFPRYGLYVVGSTMSGFGLESSDMDLCLHVRAHQHVEPRPHALLHLNYILGYIRSFDPGAELIQAKVPILKFRDVRNGLQVDLNCNNVVGIRNTDLLHCFSYALTLMVIHFLQCGTSPPAGPPPRPPRTAAPRWGSCSSTCCATTPPSRTRAWRCRSGRARACACRSAAPPAPARTTRTSGSCSASKSPST